MAKKTHDLSVKTGEYQTRDGQTKARYEPVGALMQGDNGPFIMLKRTFNPAGVPTDRDNILISAFEPRDGNQQGNSQQNSGGQHSGGSGYGAGGTSNSGGRPDFDDEIQF